MIWIVYAETVLCEMVYDSTAFEAVYGYGKRIHSEHVMAAAAKASFANRGKQPVWYLYNTDVRGGGDTEWNTSYMTQLGTTVPMNSLSAP